jgi:hypothetical protein
MEYHQEQYPQDGVNLMRRGAMVLAALLALFVLMLVVAGFRAAGWLS